MNEDTKETLCFGFFLSSIIMLALTWGGFTIAYVFGG